MTKKTPGPKAGPSLAPLGPAQAPRSEAHEQNDLRKVLDLLRVRWFHPANGELRDPVTAARLVSLGVKAGVPDVIITSKVPSRPEVRGVAIELKKRGGGRVSPDQKRWLEGLTQDGWVVAVCHGSDEAVAFLASLGWSLEAGRVGASC